VRVLHGRDQPAQVRLHLFGCARRSVDQLLRRILAGAGLAYVLYGQLGPEARMDEVPPVDVHDLAGSAELTHFGDFIPHDPGHAPGPVAEQEPQILGPVAAPAHLDIAHEQRLRNLTSIRKLPDFHRVTKVEWSADGSTVERTAIVTGGTGGLGSAVVTRLLDENWRVVVPWVFERELERVAPRDGLELIQADLFDPEAVAAVVSQAAGDPGAPLRGVANLVGGFAAGGRVHETAVEEFEAQFRLNLRPTYLVIQAAVPEMIDAGGGAIVCVSTRAALQPFPGAAGYIASKAAVIAFAQAVAVEYKNDGIRCNVILPSVIDTAANRESMPKADHERWVRPAEIGGVIAHLLSPDAAPTSGAAIPVYGRA
jgi:NAD(P)-dependent dehydrogenase (short-subunit alcohol dehydrogenase family)